MFQKYSQVKTQPVIDDHTDFFPWSRLNLFLPSQNAPGPETLGSPVLCTVTSQLYLAVGDWERVIFFFFDFWIPVFSCVRMQMAPSNNHCHLVNISSPFADRTIRCIAFLLFRHGAQWQNTISLASVNTKQKRKHIWKQIYLYLGSWNHSGHVLTAVLRTEGKSKILDTCRKLCP